MSVILGLKTISYISSCRCGTKLMTLKKVGRPKVADKKQPMSFTLSIELIELLKKERNKSLVVSQALTTYFNNKIGE